MEATDLGQPDSVSLSISSLYRHVCRDLRRIREYVPPLR
jgi:hypothetical protein